MWELKVGSPDKQQKLEICSMNGMALPVVEFSRQGYKIGKVFA